MKNGSRFLGVFLVGLLLIGFFGGCTGENKEYQKEHPIQVSNLSLSEPLLNLPVNPVYNSKLAAPMVVDLYLRGDVEIGKVSELELSAEPLIDAPNTTIEIILPDNVEYVSGDLNWEGDLNKNQKMNLKSYIRIGGAEGDFVIEGKAVSESEGFTFGKSDVLYLSVFGNTVDVGDSPKIEPIVYGGMTYQIDVLIEYEDIARTYVPEISDEEDLNTLPKKKSDFSENESATEPRAPGSGQIQIKGCIRYKDFDGNWKPAKWLKVYFYDEDYYSADDQLGTAKKVRSDGCFESDVIDNIDEPKEAGARLDVYVKFVTHNNVAKVVNEYNGVYAFYTETKPEVPNGWVDFGSQGVEGTFAAACEVFDTLMDGWDYYANTPGIGYTHGKVTCSWSWNPRDETPTEPDLDNGYNIYVAHWDYMDEDVILRVYGESVMFGVFGEFPPNSTNECWWYNHCNRRDAWKAGWGFFASCISSGDQYYKDTVDQWITINVERKPDGSEWDGDGTGDDTPSAICGALWDIYDSHHDNQDTLSLGPDEIWDVFKNYIPGGHHVYTIHGFWDGWFARRQNYRQEIWDIFSDHCIKYDYEPPVISNVYHLPEFPTPLDSVHVYCDVTDDVSGVKSVTCSYSVNGGSYIEIKMTKISGNTYRTSSPIPPQCDAEVTYKVEATDYAGKDSLSYVSSYIVGFKQLHVYPDYHDFGKMDRGETDTWTFHIENVCLSSGPMTWYVNVNDSWLSVSPTSGTTTTETDSVTVTIDTSNLECGRHYDGYIWVQTYYEEHPPIHIEVFINEYLELFVYPNSHDFGEMDKGEVDTWTFLIDNIWFTDIPFNIVENLSWISVSPASGISPEIEYITVRIDTAGLECGQHYEGYIHMQTPCQDTPIYVEVTIRDEYKVPHILLVYDDAYNQGFDTYYRDALAANGYLYDYWDVQLFGDPDLSYLNAYSMIIWVVPNDAPNDTNQATLMNYLDAGGNLFITGQDIGWYIYEYLGQTNNTFYEEYLHAVYVHDRTDLWTLTSVPGDPVTDGLYLNISGGDGADNQLHPSEIDPRGPAVTIFTYSPSGREPSISPTSAPPRPHETQSKGIISSGSAAIRVDTGLYKVVYFAFGFEAIDNPADRNIVMRKAIQWPQGSTEGSLPQLFDTNSYLVVGDDAYCTDVLGTAKISYGLALGGSSQNPEGRTHLVLTQTEHDTGNLIIVGGPAINPVADEFDKTFGIGYVNNPGVSFEISYDTYSIYLDLTQYPHEDICIVYLGEHNARNAMLVWGYGWRGTYAGSAFMGDPANWQAYEGAHMLMLRWTDSNGDGLVQMSEITVESYMQPLTMKTVIRAVVNWLRAVTDWAISLLFNTDSYLVVGDEAYCTDVLGTAKISYGLALGGSSQNPEGRTHTILTQTEHDTGNLIIVGGPAINPVADEFDKTFGIGYVNNPGVSFEISYDTYSIYLDLTQYPHEDICIVYLGEENTRNAMLVWGYGWRGTYAGSAFMGDPANWQAYEGAHMLMLRWTDSNGDGLVQMSEITVESYI